MSGPVMTQPGCGDATDPETLTLGEAQARVRARASPVEPATQVDLAHAHGRILTDDIISPIAVPAHTNSAVDGYALDGEALPAAAPRTYTLAGELHAGQPGDTTVGPGQCVRIMTGAPLPPGADTVVMQEHVEADGDRVRIGPGHGPGQNVRQAGEDLARGQTALRAGTRLDAAALGLLASLGLARVAVRRRLRIAIGSTGDEVVSPEQRPRTGQIHDSNRFALHGLLAGWGADVIDLGIIPDDAATLHRRLEQVTNEVDAVITSGGVSVGEADYVRATLQRLGEVGFWKIAIKPGRPFAFGHIGHALFFGLPGNPVAAMVTFQQLVQPALCLMAGTQIPTPLRIRARTLTRLRKRPGRTEFQRGIFHSDGDGHFTVRHTGAQGSGILRSMSEANCFIVLAHDSGPVAEGEEVLVEPFEQMG